MPLKYDIFFIIYVMFQFDIQTLHDKAIKLDNGQQIICNNEEVSGLIHCILGNFSCFFVVC